MFLEFLQKNQKPSFKSVLFVAEKCQRWVHCNCSDVPKQVNLLSHRDVIACRTCLDHNSVEEKLEFERSEVVLEEVEKVLLSFYISFTR